MTHEDLDLKLPSGGYPVSATTHMNRKFVLDSEKYLWWSEYGDFSKWYGEKFVEEYVANGAGYWRIETDDVLTQIVSMYNSLYIFGMNSLYVFSGNCEDTWGLTQVYGKKA